MATALVIKADQSMESVELGQPYFQHLHELVGGYLEPVFLASGRVMLVDEDGKRKELPVNPVASELFWQNGGSRGDCIVGTAVIVKQEVLE